MDDLRAAQELQLYVKEPRRLDHIPLSITQHIASFLDEHDALSLALTCRSLVDAGESRLYRVLPLLCHPVAQLSQTQPDLANPIYHPSPKALEIAKQYGDPMYQQDLVEWRLLNANDPPNPLTIGASSPDLLKGALRHFSRLINARPLRRKHVKEIYIDTSQTTHTRIRSTAVQFSKDMERTFASLGTFRSVEKVVIIVGPHNWKQYLSHVVELAPNLKSLTILTTAQANEISGEITYVMPNLCYLAVEPMSGREENVVAELVKQSPKLTTLILLSWSGNWWLGQRDPILRALKEKKGVATLFVSELTLETLPLERMTKVRWLGVQGAHSPSLRLTDLVIPALPRYTKLSFIKNRASTMTPVQPVRELSQLPSPIPAALIPSSIIGMLDLAPRLTEIAAPTSTQLFGQPQDRVLIRTFSRPGESLTHIRVLSSHVYHDGRWVKESHNGEGSRKDQIWQDWTDYRGRIVSLDVLERVYRVLRGIPKPGRGISMPEEAWDILEKCADTRQS